MELKRKKSPTHISISKDGVVYSLKVRRDDGDILMDRNCSDKLAHIMCWSSEYSLGDEKLSYSECQFVQNLVKAYVDTDEIYNYALAQKGSVKLAKNESGDWAVFFFGYYSYLGEKGPGEWVESTSFDNCQTLEDIKNHDGYLYIIDEMSTENCLEILSSYMAIEKLFLYDHETIALGTAPFYGQDHDDFVGVVYIDKATAISSFGEKDWQTVAYIKIDEELARYNKVLNGESYLFSVIDNCGNYVESWFDVVDSDCEETALERILESKGYSVVEEG